MLQTNARQMILRSRACRRAPRLRKRVTRCVRLFSPLASLLPSNSHLPLLFLAFLSSSFPFTNTHEIFYSFGSLFAPLLPLSLFESSPKARNVVSAFLECVFPFFSEHGGRMGFRVSGPAIQLLFEKRLKFVNTL